MKLLQVALRGEDLDRAAAFYTELLGTPPAGRFGPLLFFRVGEVRLLLEKGAGAALIYLQVPDLGQALERIPAAAQVLEDPQLIYTHSDDALGPAGAEAAMEGYTRVASRPNCHFLGHRPYELLPDYLRGADVAVIPYRLTPHTAAVFPMKVFEYLGAGLPVVSTRLPALAAVGNLPVRQEEEAGKFADAVASQHRDPVADADRSRFAGAHTWNDLLNGMTEALVPARRPSAQSDES